MKKFDAVLSFFFCFCAIWWSCCCPLNAVKAKLESSRSTSAREPLEGAKCEKF